MLLSSTLDPALLAAGIFSTSLWQTYLGPTMLQAGYKFRDGDQLKAVHVEWVQSQVGKRQAQLRLGM